MKIQKDRAQCYVEMGNGMEWKLDRIDLNLCPMCGRLGLENPSSISSYYLILCLKIFMCKMSIVISSQQYFKLYEIIY